MALEQAAAARLEMDVAREKADAALRERDAAARQAADATSRVEAWVGVAMVLQNTASGTLFSSQRTTYTLQTPPRMALCAPSMAASHRTQSNVALSVMSTAPGCVSP